MQSQGRRAFYRFGGDLLKVNVINKQQSWISTSNKLQISALSLKVLDLFDAPVEKGGCDAFAPLVDWFACFDEIFADVVEFTPWTDY